MDVRRIEFGDVTIEWDGRWQFPIAVNHNKLNGEKPLITQCPVIYHWGEGDHRDTKVVWADFGFDGASIPKIIQLVPGYSKIGWHLFATLLHDFSCDHPRLIPRPIGDGIFCTLLMAIAEHGQKAFLAEPGHEKAAKKRRRQAWMMARAVSLWTFIQAMRGVPIMSLGEA